MRYGAQGQNRRNDNHKSNGGSRPQRPPLEWQVVKVVNQGHVRGVVTRAFLDNGSSRYSFRIGKADREDPERIRTNIDARDLKDAGFVFDEVEEFINGEQN